MKEEVTVIDVRDLSKKYQIGKYRDSTLNTFFKNLLSRNKSEEFWALKNISLKVRKGEKIGIIGNNGAGKSTLLKVLSKITSPTSGSINLKGRVTSLLEIGTGFHPELTGRENIYLNGSILGMRKQKINDLLDEIIDFAEIHHFIDTPVKRYSSGMYVRLAFAVATFLEFEILIIDEVLAVGDVLFQRKCIKRLNDLVKTDITLLVVSHNYNLISDLCDRCIVIEHGQIKEDGPSSKIISSLLGQRSFSKIESEKLILKDIIFNDQGGVYYKKPLHIKMICHSFERLENLSYRLMIHNAYGQLLFVCNSNLVATSFSINKQLYFTLDCNIDEVPLMSGEYILGICILEDKKVLIETSNACSFSCINNNNFNVEPHEKRGVLVQYSAGLVLIEQ